jgi:hypothetical protein
MFSHENPTRKRAKAFAFDVDRASLACLRDLIVIGTEGKMGLGQSVLPGRWVGSVAGKVLRSAPCPGVTVKTPDTSAQPSSDSEPQVEAFRNAP